MSKKVREFDPKPIESTFNQGLGEALRLTRFAWREYPNRILVEMTRVLTENQSSRPDVIVSDRDTKPVVIETSFVHGDADTDAQKRLGKTYSRNSEKIMSSIAIQLDENYRELTRVGDVTNALVDGRSLLYALHQQIESTQGTEFRRRPHSGFFEGSVFDLSALIVAEATPHEKVEEVAKFVAHKIRAASAFFQDQIDTVRVDEYAELTQQRTHLSALNTTMVLWLNAVVVHQQLSRMFPPQLVDATVLVDDPLIPKRIYDKWNEILKENWYSVFQPAVNLLAKHLGSDGFSTSRALHLVVQAAQHIEASRVGTQMNIGAELFPQLADDRKESAAFYTQPSTAELLSQLTIRAEDLEPAEWARTDFFQHHSIADLACGTGTLLRAGYRNVCQLHERFGVNNHRSSSLHRDAMEQGLVGADISPIAAHLTTSSLALMNLTKTYSDTRIGWLQVGGANGKTGSLEYLKETQASDFFDQLGGMSAGTQTSKQDETLFVGDKSIDWMLMNPPYSRTRKGQSAFDVSGVDETTRKACQKRWKELTHNEPLNIKAGMAASFLVIAKKKIKPGGRIGFVLPLTAAFAPTWQQTRTMLLQEFHDICAIAITGGKALGKKALSADTGMEEMLLVATRNRNSHQGSKKIWFVTLRDPLSSIGVARELANAILSAKKSVDKPGQWYPVRLGGDDVGHVFLDELSENGAIWSPLSVSNPHLVNVSANLLNGTLRWKDQAFNLGIPMSTIENVFQVGPTHHLIGHVKGGDPIGAFEMHEVHSDDSPINPDMSVWHVNSQVQRQLLVNPTHKAVHVPHHNRKDLQKSMRKTMSTLLYSRNMRWTAQALIAAKTKVPVLGGRSWTTLQHKDKRVLSAMLIWANSTLGMIAHWTQGQRTHAGRSTTQISALRSIPCPKLDALNNQILKYAEDQGKLLLRKKLLPACQAHCDPVRIDIDRIVRTMFDLPEEVHDIMDEVRYLWCREPSIHGQNRRALKLLAEH